MVYNPNKYVSLFPINCSLCLFIYKHISQIKRKVKYLLTNEEYCKNCCHLLQIKINIFAIFNVYFCCIILSVLLSSCDLHCGVFLLRSVFFFLYIEKLSLTYLSQNHLLRIKNRTYVMQCTGLTDFPIRFERAFSEAKVVEQRYIHNIRAIQQQQQKCRLCIIIHNRRKSRTQKIIQEKARRISGRPTDRPNSTYTAVNLQLSYPNVLLYVYSIYMYTDESMSIIHMYIRVEYTVRAYTLDIIFSQFASCFSNIVHSPYSYTLCTLNDILDATEIMPK